jgi:hypothetical protein
MIILDYKIFCISFLFCTTVYIKVNYLRDLINNGILNVATSYVNEPYSSRYFLRKNIFTLNFFGK